MKKTGWTIICMTLIAVLAGCVETKTQVKKQPDVYGESAYTGAPVRVAILNFENNSITDAKKVAPLTKGLSSMLATDLANLESVQIVEREKILSVIEELKLGQMGMIGDDTAIQVGKMAGAENIIFGSFVVFENKMRIDVRMVATETSLLVLAEQISGSADAFFEMEKELVRKIASSLRVKLSEREKSKLEAESRGSFQAAIYYSKGVEYMDAGDLDRATQMFQEALRIDPNFTAAREKLDML